MLVHHVCSVGSELHCDYLIHFNTDILTARPLPKPHFQHSVLDSSCVCVHVRVCAYH